MFRRRRGAFPTEPIPNPNRRAGRVGCVFPKRVKALAASSPNRGQTPHFSGTLGPMRSAVPTNSHWWNAPPSDRQSYSRVPRGSPVPSCCQPFVVDRPTGAADPFHSLEIRHYRRARPYLMTLSARARTLGGIVRPIRLAVFRLMTNSNFTGWMTGRWQVSPVEYPGYVEGGLTIPVGCSAYANRLPASAA
jgi:hypothetical protein